MLDPSAAAAAVDPLSAYTTLRLGGPAGRLVVAAGDEEIVDLLRALRRQGEPVFVLAGGSNVVIDDSGYPGTVLVVRSTGLTVTRSGADVELTVAAGESWDAVVATAVGEGWAGIECLSGIPGSAGATPMQNVGAYGQEVAESITAVRVYDRVDDRMYTMSPAECGFGYRTSIFRRSDRWTVLSVDFRLARSATSSPIRYAELARTLDVPLGATAPLADVRAAVLALRAGKGMVLNDGDPDTYSVGSFFTNPVLDPNAYAALLARADGAPLAAWPSPDGTTKVSAAALIERSGYGKGYGHGGGVAVSAKHTLALTNRGTGSTAALLDLAREIRGGVQARFGIRLHPEPVVVPPAVL